MRGGVVLGLGLTSVCVCVLHVAMDAVQPPAALYSYTEPLLSGLTLYRSSSSSMNNGLCVYLCNNASVSLMQSKHYI